MCVCLCVCRCVGRCVVVGVVELGQSNRQSGVSDRVREWMSRPRRKTASGSKRRRKEKKRHTHVGLCPRQGLGVDAEKDNNDKSDDDNKDDDLCVLFACVVVFFVVDFRFGCWLRALARGFFLLFRRRSFPFPWFVKETKTLTKTKTNEQTHTHKEGQPVQTATQTRRLLLPVTLTATLLLMSATNQSLTVFHHRQDSDKNLRPAPELASTKGYPVRKPI